MKASNVLIIPLFALAAACGGDNTAAATLGMSDSKIAALVYNPEYSGPDGFFRDARADTQRSYTIHHVTDASGSFELCTDDYQTAVNWEAADNASRAVNGEFVSVAETGRYFEVVRELDYNDDVSNVGDPTSPGYARVFKCSHTRRDGVDRNLLDGFAGTLNARPIDANSMREFTEYLWQFRFFAGGRRVVLDSAGGSTATKVEHTLRIAFRINQGAGRCDRIEVADWRFAADRESGDVQKTFTTVRAFDAELRDGVATLCN